MSRTAEQAGQRRKTRVPGSAAHALFLWPTSYLHGDDGNLIREQIGWVERYDRGKQWKGYAKHGPCPCRRSRPEAARDVVRDWRFWSQR